MEKKFTLRIGDAEVEKLDALKKMTGEKTDTGAIKYIIRNFEKLNVRYKNEIKQTQIFKQKNLEIEEKIQNFLAAFESLKLK